MEAESRHYRRLVVAEEDAVSFNVCYWRGQDDCFGLQRWEPEHKALDWRVEIGLLTCGVKQHLWGKTAFVFNCRWKRFFSVLLPSLLAALDIEKLIGTR